MPPDAEVPALREERCGATAVRTRLKPSARDVRRILADLCADWRRQGVAEAMIERAELVLAEALNNVVEHAQRDHPEGTIELQSTVMRDGLELRLFDDGAPMPGKSLPGGDAPVPQAGADIPEGGFGWYLIRCLADELHYRRLPEGNCLHIRLDGTRG